MHHPTSARHGLVLVLLFASTLSLLLGLSALLFVANAAPTTITWNPPSLNPTLAQGSTATSTVTFTSLDPLNNVALSLTPALKGLVTFTPAQFSRVLPGTKYTVQVTFKIPPTAKPQDYIGELALAAGKTTLPNTLKLGFHVVAAGQPTPTRTGAASPTAAKRATATRTPTRTATPNPTRRTTTKRPLKGVRTTTAALLSGTGDNNGLGLEHYWTYRQLQLTDRLTLYVNLYDGNLIAEYDELSIPARGIPLALNHTYNSGADLGNAAGYDWVRSLDQRIEENGDGSVTLYDGDGTALLFTNPVSGTYTSPAGSSDQLTKAQDGTFTLLHKDQSTDTFRKNAGTNSLLVNQADRFANGLTLGYDGSDRLTSVQSSGGPTFTLSYDGGTGKLSSVTDLANRTFAYTYSGDDLATITDPMTHTTTFTYTSHLLTGIGDPRATATSILYDASNRVQSISVAGVTVATFSYNGSTTTFTDGNNHTTTYTLNTTGQVTQVLDAANGRTSYSYDANYYVTDTTDPLSHHTQGTYDGSGNLLSQTDALTHTTVYTYNVTNDLLAVTDPLSRTASYAYDGAGNLTVMTDTMLYTTSYTYDGQGQRLSATDANNHTTSYGYSPEGYLVTVTDTLGAVTHYTYDTVGNRTGVVDALNRQTISLYDADDRLTQVNAPLSTTTQYEYDANGNRTKLTDANNHATTYGYDAFNRQTAVTDTLNEVTQYRYDPVGNRTGVTDANQNPITYTYDALNRQTAVTDALNHTTQYGYDAVGNRTVITDANNHVTVYAYDPLNRQTSSTDPLSHTVQYVYDAVGNRTNVIDARNHPITYTYDALNRVSTASDALSNTTQYSYDPAGNRTKVIDPLAHPVTYTYDALNRLASTIDALNQVTQYGYDAVGNRTVMTDAVAGVTTYVYDDLNRPTTTLEPSGKRKSVGYDAVGNVITSTDELTRTTRYAYDDVSRVISTTNPLTQTTRYGYDAVGNTKVITDPTGLLTTFDYDPASRLITKTTPTGPTGYTYDNVGNVLVQTDGSGATSTFTYDAANRPAQEDDRDPQQVLVVSYVYTYDENGNRTGVTETRPNQPARPMSWSYDANNQLLSETDVNGGVTGYTYDAAGNRSSVTDPAGIASTVTYNATNLPDQTVRRLGAGVVDTTTLTYESRNYLASQVSVTGTLRVTQTGTYNPNDYIATWNSYGRGGGSTSYLGSLTYTDDNLLSQTTGTRAELYRYDAAGRLQCRDLNGGAPMMWRYDADGRRTDQYSDYIQPPLSKITCRDYPYGEERSWYNHTRYTYTVNALTLLTNDRYYATNLSSHAVRSTFQYDAHGNLAQEYRQDYQAGVTTTFQYSWTWQAGAYRMTNFVSTPGITITFEYDALGRISRRYIAQGYDDYQYLGGTDWLVREVWHSAIYPYRVFELYRVEPLNGRPGREILTRTTADYSSVTGSNTFYLVYTWHGDALRIDTSGGGDLGMLANDPWGGHYNADLPSRYRWNGGWGYLYFRDLQLYYAHGRWYNPVTALWLSPDEKGEYTYGSGQDAVNWYVGQLWAGARWQYQQFQSLSQATVEPLIAAGNSSPEAKALVLEAGQFVADTAMASHYAMLPPPNWTLWDRVGNATRATVPVVMAEGAVAFGPSAGSYLYRTLIGRLTSRAATPCVVDLKDCTNAVTKLSNAASTVWQVDVFKRARMIEELLGRGQLLKDKFNFPVIDRFENGVATSIKSIDLRAVSYQNLDALTRTVSGYVTKLGTWQGTSWGGVSISAKQIMERQLQLAVPPGVSDAQLQVLVNLQNWATAVGVNLSVVGFK